MDLIKAFNILKKIKNLSLIFVGFEDGIKISEIKSNIEKIQKIFIILNTHLILNIS